MALPNTAAAAAESPDHLVARGVAVTFAHRGRQQTVLQDVDLKVPRGSVSALIGPSGCGKSTLLKVLAGLQATSAGEARVAGLPPQEAARRCLIGFVFQEANLLPWKTALENAAFLLETANPSLARRTVRERAAAMLEVVGLAQALDKRPSQLSGGMRQRVAIARALALDPEVLLMDEPFGALDAITREEMCLFLLDLWRRTGKTIVLVTHSIDEAVLLAHHVHVMGHWPARIIESAEIDLPQPRGADSFTAPQFAAIETRLRHLLLESHAGRGGR